MPVGRSCNHATSCLPWSVNTDLTSSGQDAPPPFTQLHKPLTLGRLRTPPRPLPHTTRRRQHNLQHLGSVATVDGNRLAIRGSIFSRAGSSQRRNTGGSWRLAAL